MHSAPIASDPSAASGANPRVLIVAEHASAKFGGEAILPLHYFRVLRKRGVEAWLIVHSRTQGELTALFPHDISRIHFIPDTRFHRALYWLGKPLPGHLRHFTLGFLSRLSSQRQARRLARKLIAEQQIDVVHQPIPVSPKESSLLYNLGVPVIIGPMNGGMSYPPGFTHSQGVATAAFMRIGRFFSGLLNALMPGKLNAAALLVANERTRRALPKGVKGQIITLPENGVDLSVWSPIEQPPDAGSEVRRRAGSSTEESGSSAYLRTGVGIQLSNDASPFPTLTRFAFTGRLVDWKAVDVLLDAFKLVVEKIPATLDILGDGAMREPLKLQAKTLGLDNNVHFRGWVAQADCAAILRQTDAMVLPSLYECGGAVVLEAMALGLPVIATDWGGPADYLDATSGILVPAKSRSQFVADLAAAMLKLAGAPELRREMGQAGRKRAEESFDWERKTDRILDIYRDAIAVRRQHYDPRNDN